MSFENIDEKTKEILKWALASLKDTIISRADYVNEEMLKRNPNADGFMSYQSILQGESGKFYLFDVSEINGLLSKLQTKEIPERLKKVYFIYVAIEKEGRKFVASNLIGQTYSRQEAESGFGLGVSEIDIVPGKEYPYHNELTLGKYEGRVIEVKEYDKITGEMYLYNGAEWQYIGIASKLNVRERKKPKMTEAENPDDLPF